MNHIVNRFLTSSWQQKYMGVALGTGGLTTLLTSIDCAHKSQNPIEATIGLVPCIAVV
jgi:hypothetical protein